jgi:iron-sulfur cluster assembly accessory protein
METVNNSTETKNELPVKFTESAIEELNRLYSDLNLDNDSALRIGVKGGGCSGMSYLLAFDKEEDGDTHYQLGQIPVVMKKAHVMYVIGSMG